MTTDKTLQRACGPQKWRISTLRNIEVSDTVTKKISTSIEKGKKCDPLPTLREQCVLESNTKIIKYMRGVREVVTRLRESLGLINEEIKSLLLCKDALERAFEHVRKDIRLNKDTIELRTARPRREKQKDQADRLLLREKQELLSIKKTHEASLRAAQKQLAELNASRKRLSEVLLERNQVVDFLAEHAKNGKKERAQSTLKTERRYVKEEDEEEIAPEIIPLIDTPEAIEADKVSADAREKSDRIRAQIKKTIGDCYQKQKIAHDNVNAGLIKKVAETVSLEQQLDIARGKNRAAIHRQQRHQDLTKTAKGYADGPEAVEDITTREKVTRPYVRVFQRHPATELSEMQKVMRASTTLGMSVEESMRNLQLLKQAKERLNADLKDKRAATSTDTALVRLRRRRANHRWVLDNLPAANSILTDSITPWYDTHK